MDLREEIKSRVSMKDILDYYGVYPVRGKNIYRCCFHGDKNPSANIVKNSDKFHCFSCHVTYDIFDFVQHKEQCDFKTALKFIDKNFRLGLVENLSFEETIKIVKKQKERKLKKQLEIAQKRLEYDIINKIIENIKLWKEIQQNCHPKRGEVRTGKWEFADLYFYSIEEQERLYWLYDILCGFEPVECEYTYLYGNNKKEIISKIKEGIITI